MPPLGFGTGKNSAAARPTRVHGSVAAAPRRSNSRIARSATRSAARSTNDARSARRAAFFSRRESAFESFESFAESLESTPSSSSTEAARSALAASGGNGIDRALDATPEWPRRYSSRSPRGALRCLLRSSASRPASSFDKTLSHRATRSGSSVDWNDLNAQTLLGPSSALATTGSGSSPRATLRSQSASLRSNPPTRISSAAGTAASAAAVNPPTLEDPRPAGFAISRSCAARIVL